MSRQSARPRSYTGYTLREVREDQILELADSSYAILTKQRRRGLVHLDLEANDGARTTLIGVPGARVRLGERASTTPIPGPGGGAANHATGTQDESSPAGSQRTA